VSRRFRSALILLLALISAACGDDTNHSARNAIQPVYNTQTGRLELLKYDANGNHKPDTFSYMNGAQILRIEIDPDEDGRIDRWEYYVDGALVRLAVSTRHDGKATRMEFFEGNLLARAEEDTDFDGHIDKWETFDAAGRMSSVAFDTTHQGRADRRLMYGPGGTARVEIDRSGAGVWQPASL
jgi:hypothetical protein